MRETERRLLQMVARGSKAHAGQAQDAGDFEEAQEHQACADRAVKRLAGDTPPDGAGHDPR